MRFDQAESFLLSRRRLGMKFGLRNIRGALTRLGHPERHYPSVIVAGSKGKGSVCALLESILLEAGIPTGLYTSPHLVSVCERIRVNGAAISPGEFGGLIGDLREEFGRALPQLTYFEWVTAAALEHFARRGVALALLEVGLGGRLDATNAVDAVCAVVTEIEREHTEYLGTGLASIAREKGGVMRRGAPCLIGATPPSARRALAACAAQSGAVPLWLHREARWEVLGHSRRGLRLDVRTRGGRYAGLRLGLLGRHQAHNAALTVLAAEVLRARGFPVGTPAIRVGLSRARWPGRCDLRPGRPPLLLDGAHTTGSARALSQVLEELFPRRRLVFVFGALREKDLRGMARALFPCAARVLLVRPPEERGASPEEMLRGLPAALRARCAPVADCGSALAAARREAGPRGLVVVTGSLFLVGEALALLEREPPAGCRAPASPAPGRVRVSRRAARRGKGR